MTAQVWELVEEFFGQQPGDVKLCGSGEVMAAQDRKFVPEQLLIAPNVFAIGEREQIAVRKELLQRG